MERKTTQTHETQKTKLILQIPTDVWMYCVMIFCDLESLKTLRFVFSERLIHSTHWKKIFFKWQFDIYGSMMNIPSIISNLKICGPSIVDDELKHLTEIHTLDLKYCKQITDKGLVYLKGIHTLKLSGCKQITDKGLEYLKGIHTLNVFGCKQITDKGLQYLK